MAKGQHTIIKGVYRDGPHPNGEYTYSFVPHVREQRWSFNLRSNFELTADRCTEIRSAAIDVITAILDAGRLQSRATRQEVANALATQFSSYVRAGTQRWNHDAEEIGGMPDVEMVAKVGELTGKLQAYADAAAEREADYAALADDAKVLRARVEELEGQLKIAEEAGANIIEQRDAARSENEQHLAEITRLKNELKTLPARLSLSGESGANAYKKGAGDAIAAIDLLKDLGLKPVRA